MDNVIVLDNGSGMCKAGFGGEDSPRVVINAIVGRAKHDSVMVGMGDKDLYVGEEAQAKRGILIISYPIVNGIVVDWDDMTELWNDVFYNELRVESSEYYTMLTEAPMNPKRNREKMVDIFFSTFNVPGTYVQIQALLALYASGGTTGIVLDAGDGVTHTVPVYEGYSIQNAIGRLDMAGRSVTKQLQGILTELGHHLMTSAELEICRILKEKHCYVALNYDMTMQEYETDPTKFECLAELPDKEVIDLSYSTFKAPECLFRPSMAGIEAEGVSELTHSTIKKCDLDLRAPMYSQIVVAGGTTLLRGFPERVQKDIADKTSSNLKVKIHAQPERKFSVWIGGSILSSLSTFKNSWVTKSEFEEAGPSIVHRKCF